MLKKKLKTKNATGQVDRHYKRFLFAISYLLNDSVYTKLNIFEKNYVLNILKFRDKSKFSDINFFILTQVNSVFLKHQKESVKNER